MAKKIRKKAWVPRIVRSYDTTENIILRDFLALERTTLANERTLFAYLRTSLYLILGGIAFLQLREFDRLRWLGYLSFSISAFLIVFGLLRFILLRQKLGKFYGKIQLPKSAKEGVIKESVS